ncbi:MAG: PSD1 domain-containing protein [Planctomycetes bacterium]|nr:PSD1 domain-containing protein [Planctomycetota bacterium]
MNKCTLHDRRVLALTSIGLAITFVACGSHRLEAAPVDFNRDVRPILSNNCFQCHGPGASNRKAGLRLDIESGAKADMGEYRAVAPGRPNQSELISRITHSDPDERMPPADSGKALSSEEIAVLKRWIAEGAGWSRHWAYEPPKKHPIPEVKNSDWPLNWIDPFLLAKLESADLFPSPDADRVTLLRRLSFDLTGLPPTWEDVSSFLADEKPDAYEKRVDRLLASPAYGERMAMYWLDLVRFADTVGYHGDQDHSISPYRDWVIDAFNRNMRLDQFTRDQLAGDLLPDSSIDQKIASGYNRLLQTSHEGGVQPKEYLAIYAADRVRNISAVWMGATMGCCQCHDHKFDPYTMKDFYSMAAYFADIDEARHLTEGTNTLPTKREPEMKVLSRAERERIDALTSRIATWHADLSPKSPQDAARRPLRKRIRDAQRELETIQKNARLTMITVAIEPRVMRILPRGNWLDESGPIVQPEVPEFLRPLRRATGRANRQDLANWLTDPEHGCGLLTARVFANRFWYLTFGVGIVKVLDDFGGQGEAPVHPELLDNLAIEFVQSGWNIKHMMKLLVMSRAYRQSSVVSDALERVDPYNRLVARQSRFRLSAEMVRDTALAISGLLVRDIGGPSVKPYQPAGYYRHLNFPERRYTAHTDRRQWRRGVYMHWQRQFLHPMLKAFDAPSREECTAQRARSNTPLAVLVLLNDPTFVEAARVFAQNILCQPGSAEFRIDFAFQQAVSRRPDDWERQKLADLLTASREQYRSNTEGAVQLIHIGEAPPATDVEPFELAAWTTVARAILNLNETITRN